MKNTLTKTTTFGIFATIYSIIISIWFSNICGMLGTFHWHMLYRSIYITLMILTFVPLTAMVLRYFVSNKFTKFLVIFFSILIMVIWTGFFGALKGLTSVKIDNSGLNIIHQSEQLPARNRGQDEPLLHLAFASDPHWGSSRANKEARIKIMQTINSNSDYDGMFILGDIAEMGMLAGDVKYAVDELRTYLPDTRFRTIPGNHDAILNGLALYDSVFQVKGEKHHFRMDNGTVHFLFINMLWDTTELDKKQIKWLIKNLEEIPQEDTVIVMSHCYAVSSGYYDENAKKMWGDLPDVMAKLCPILEKYNVDLHMSGHDHFFEYLKKDNVDYMVLGAMGGHLDDELIYYSPYSKYLNNKVHGYVDMKIFKDYIDLSCIDSDGETIFTNKIETK